MELFQNKSIAVVGNAGSLFEKDLGSLIDYYDVVCRFNSGAHVEDPSKQGRRTNIVFVNGLKSQLPRYKTTTVHTSLKHRVKGRSPHCDHVIPESIIHELCDVINAPRPSSGCMALHWIASCEPSRVGVFGFDWKATKTFYHKTNRKDPHNWEHEKTYISKLITESPDWKLY